VLRSGRRASKGGNAAILKGQWQKVDVLWQDIGIPTRAK